MWGVTATGFSWKTAKAARQEARAWYPATWHPYPLLQQVREFGRVSNYELGGAGN